MNWDIKRENDMIKFTKNIEIVTNEENLFNLYIGTSHNTAFGIKLFVNFKEKHHMYYFRMTRTENKLYYGRVSSDDSV